jgi:hypothetical protein
VEEKEKRSGATATSEADSSMACTLDLTLNQRDLDSDYYSGAYLVIHTKTKRIAHLFSMGKN